MSRNDQFEQGIGVGGASSQDTRPISTESFVEVQTRLASRSVLSPDDAAQLADRGPLLRRRYNEQLQRAKIQFVDPRLKLSSCQALVRLARQAATVSQLVYQAFPLLDVAASGAGRPVVAPDVIETAIDWNDRQIERIAGGLQTLDAADTQSAWLRALFGQVESCPRVSSAGWQTLAQQVLTTAEFSPDPASALPVPGVSLAAYLTEIGQGHYAEVLSRGIESARIVAWMLTRRGAERFDVELLTLAALCQDCGLLQLRRSRPDAKPTVSTKQVRDLHPSIGAGLIAGLVDFSTELPALVAQHHRRINELYVGPDFPGRHQNRGSRLLAVAVRLLELIAECGPAIANGEPLAGRDAFSDAARRLVRETQRGDWDRGLAGQMLAVLGYRAESESLLQGTRAVASFDSHADTHRRLDAADQRWPEPNLELEQSREKIDARASAR